MEVKLFDLLEGLSDEEWQRKVDDRWTIKDTVAHLVGWEKECTQQIPIIWQTKKKPWFLEIANDDEFNSASIGSYYKMTPRQLLDEWYKWQDSLEEEIQRIGESNLKSRPDLFSWLFETENTAAETNESHYAHHLEQIKKALGRH